MSSLSGGRTLTVREAARRVHRAEETIRRWIWTGKLPARKRGKSYQVRESDLDAVAASLSAPRKPNESELSLGGWVAAVKVWRATNDVSPHGGAGQLVIEDRAERSGLGGR